MVPMQESRQGRHEWDPPSVLPGPQVTQGLGWLWSTRGQKPTWEGAPVPTRLECPGEIWSGRSQRSHVWGAWFRCSGSH